MAMAAIASDVVKSTAPAAAIVSDVVMSSAPACQPSVAVPDGSSAHVMWNTNFATEEAAIEHARANLKYFPSGTTSSFHCQTLVMIVAMV